MRRKNKIDSLPLGVFLGLLLPFVIFLSMKGSQFQELNLSDLISNVLFRTVFYRIVTLSLLPSLVLFFVSIKAKKDKLSKGILFSTMLLVAVTVIIFVIN
ncbi:MAG: hypothetical protein ACK5L5_06270 [Bacteroidales bacterium]